MPDTRAALAELASAYYNDPTRQLKLIGITGTNGKTTTAHIIETILGAAEKKVGMLGTITYRYPGFTRPAQRTTPDALELQELFDSMVRSAVEWAVMEVSSHGLDQQRIDGCHFDVAIFTNLTPEHLDYHRDMESYFKAKQRLFNAVLPRSAKHAVALSSMLMILQVGVLPLSVLLRSLPTDCTTVTCTPLMRFVRWKVSGRRL